MVEAKPEGASDAEENDDEPDEEDASGDDGFGFEGVRNVDDDFRDGVCDFILCFVARGSEEALCAAGAVFICQTGGSAEGEGVVVEEWEIDVGVVVDPGEAFLDRSNLEADEAFEDAGDRVVEDGAAESLIELADGLFNEGVEGVVDGACGGIDPAEDVMVDVVVEVRDGGVGAVSPGFGGVVKFGDDQVGEISDVVGEGGDFLLDGLQEDVLAEAGEEAGYAEGEDDEGGG